MHRLNMLPRSFSSKVEKGEDGKIYFCCSNCWSNGNILDINAPEHQFSLLTLGINNLALWNSPEKRFGQYDYIEWQPFVFEKFKFCEECTPYMVERIHRIVAKHTAYSYEDLLCKPDQPKLDPKLGHHITLIEYIPKKFGRFFNIQVDRETFRRMIDESFPRNIIHFHLKGYGGW